MALLGTPMALADQITDDDIEALEGCAGRPRNGFPLVALLQLVRVYAQSFGRSPRPRFASSTSSSTSR